MLVINENDVMKVDEVGSVRYSSKWEKCGAWSISERQHIAENTRLCKWVHQRATRSESALSATSYDKISGWWQRPERRLHWPRAGGQYRYSGGAGQCTASRPTRRWSPRPQPIHHIPHCCTLHLRCACLSFNACVAHIHTYQPICCSQIVAAIKIRSLTLRNLGTVSKKT